MAEAQIDPEQLKKAVEYAVQRALERDPRIITGPITVGIIAYPDDGNVNYKEIIAQKFDASS